MKKLSLVLLLPIAFGLVTPKAHAADAAISLGTGYSTFTNGSWSLGFEFSPTTNIEVTSLGSFFPTGATDTHGVSLWDSSENLLATTTVTGDGSQAFEFTAIAPIELIAGDDYVVSGTTLSDPYVGFDISNFNIGPGINVLDHQEVGCSGVTPCYPTNVDTSGFADFGGDFTYTAATTTPEPSTLLMLGSGLVGFAGMVRRKIASR
jgi:hypothetical protein